MRRLRVSKSALTLTRPTLNPEWEGTMLSWLTESDIAMSMAL